MVFRLVDTSDLIVDTPGHQHNRNDRNISTVIKLYKKKMIHFVSNSKCFRTLKGIKQHKWSITRFLPLFSRSVEGQASHFRGTVRARTFPL